MHVHYYLDIYKSCILLHGNIYEFVAICSDECELDIRW